MERAISIHRPGCAQRLPRDPKDMTVTVAKTTFSKYRIQFIGKGWQGACTRRWRARRRTRSPGRRLRTGARAREQWADGLDATDTGEVTRYRSAPVALGAVIA
jgi:hypothetical protein